MSGALQSPLQQRKQHVEENIDEELKYRRERVDEVMECSGGRSYNRVGVEAFVADVGQGGVHCSVDEEQEHLCDGHCAAEAWRTGEMSSGVANFRAGLVNGQGNAKTG